jgi:hypothetical protein
MTNFGETMWVKQCGGRVIFGQMLWLNARLQTEINYVCTAAV